MKPSSAVFSLPEGHTWEEMMQAVLATYASRAWENWDINPVDGRVLCTFEDESVTFYWHELEVA